MNAVGVQSFFDERDDAVELAYAIAGDMASGYDFHAVELPNVEVVDVFDPLDELHLLKQGVRVDVLWNKLHDDLCHANELRDGGVCDDDDDEQGTERVDYKAIRRAPVFDNEAGYYDADGSQRIAEYVEEGCSHILVHVQTTAMTVLAGVGLRFSGIMSVTTAACAIAIAMTMTMTVVVVVVVVVMFVAVSATAVRFVIIMMRSKLDVAFRAAATGQCIISKETVLARGVFGSC